MTERAGVLAAVLSSAFGGVAAAATRFVIPGTDPITLAALRFGLGFLFLLPIAIARRRRWPPGRDWPAVIALGLLFFAVFFVLFNIALRHTTAARGTLALSTLPLLTMVVAGALGVEPLTGRKTAGVLVAMTGVAVALAAGALCMAFYSARSRPYIGRSGPLTFTTAGMGAGATVLALIAWWSGGFAAAGRFGRAEWAAVGYLGAFGGALVFYLWAFALDRTTPTRVASTITVNPVTAAVVASAILGEPIGLNLVVGVTAVAAGIWIASTSPHPVR